MQLIHLFCYTIHFFGNKNIIKMRNTATIEIISYYKNSL